MIVLFAFTSSLYVCFQEGLCLGCGWNYPSGAAESALPHKNVRHHFLCTRFSNLNGQCPFQVEWLFRVILLKNLDLIVEVSNG